MSSVTYPLCLIRFSTAFLYYNLAFIHLAQMALVNAYRSGTHLKKTAQAALELVKLIIGQTRKSLPDGYSIQLHNLMTAVPSLGDAYQQVLKGMDIQRLRHYLH